MSRFIGFLFSPDGVVVVLLLAVLAWQARPVSRRMRRLFLAVGVAYALASIYAVPFAVGRILTLGLHPLAAADVPPGRTAIVLLGAGNSTIVDWSGGEFAILDFTGAARVQEAARVYRLTGAAWVVSSGGPPASQTAQQPSGVTMGDALVQLGVPRSRILVEDRPRDTHDEAVLIVPKLRPLNIDRAILVTSDIHMRRSLAAFRAQGLEAVPAMARDPFASMSWSERLMPTSRALGLSRGIVHEVLGIAYYAVRGWGRF